MTSVKQPGELRSPLLPQRADRVFNHARVDWCWRQRPCTSFCNWSSRPSTVRHDIGARPAFTSS